MKKYIFIILIFLSLIFGCSKKSIHINIARNMLTALNDYSMILENVNSWYVDLRRNGQQRELTNDYKKQIINAHKKIRSFRQKIEKLTTSYDNDEDIQKITNKIVIANVNILRLENKIRYIPGIKKFFAELTRMNLEQR